VWGSLEIVAEFRPSNIHISGIHLQIAVAREDK
jgi:hypothetical protein